MGQVLVVVVIKAVGHGGKTATMLLAVSDGRDAGDAGDSVDVGCLALVMVCCFDRLLFQSFSSVSFASCRVVGVPGRLVV